MIAMQWNPDEHVRIEWNHNHRERYILNCRWDEEKPMITFIFSHPPFGHEDLVSSNR